MTLISTSCVTFRALALSFHGILRHILIYIIHDDRTLIDCFADFIIVVSFFITYYALAGLFSGSDFLRIVKNNVGIAATTQKPIAHQKETLKALAIA